MIGVSIVGASLLNKQDFDAVPLFVNVILGILAAMVLVAVFMRRWFFARRRILTHRITAEYVAPLEFDPAEMSYLFRRKLDERDFAALLVFMSQRGVIHFRKHDGKKVVLPGPKYEGNLKPYERLILEVVEENRFLPASELLMGYDSIFKRNSKDATLSSLVRADLEKRGFIKKNYIARYMQSIFKGTLLSLIAIVWLPSVFLWFYGLVTQGGSDFTNIDNVVYTSLMMSLAATVPILGFVIVVRFLQSRSLGRSWIAENKLRRFWPHIIGFRQFVCLSEKEKLNFESKTLKKTSEINTLPYAIAFRLVENWRSIIA